MVKFVRNIFLLLLFAAVSCFSADFMGIPIEERASENDRPLPKWMFGGGASLAYYVNFDCVFGAEVDYRLHPNHSLGVFGQIPVLGDFKELGLDWRWFFKGSLMYAGHDDFLQFAFSGLYMHHNGEKFFSPTLTFGYGRDVLFFEKGRLVGRIEIMGKYVMGEPVFKKNERFYFDEYSHFLALFRLSLFFF